MLDGVSATCIGTVATTENYGVQLIGPSGEIMDTVRKELGPVLEEDQADGKISGNRLRITHSDGALPLPLSGTSAFWLQHF